MKKDKFVCELCLESVARMEPHIRIGVDSVIQKDDDSYSSLVNQDVMVFAVFHNECVKSSINNEDCDDVQYIAEARYMMTTMGADLKLPEKQKEKTAKIVRHLTCLNGGLTG